VRDMGDLRNSVAHTGHDARLTPELLDKYLEAVRDLIWLLDHYAGNTWARDYVGRERLRELETAHRVQK
jgi:hypothetical protein